MPVDIRLAELSRTIDAAELGRRLRIARVAAGLTQGQVGEVGVTSAYISRIEDGQRRPKLDLLVRMAERIGTSVRDLLEDSTSTAQLRVMVALEHAELDLRHGHATEALSGVLRLLEELGSEGSPDLRRRAAIVHAGALEATGDAHAAILVLDRLVAAPSGLVDRAERLTALSRCLRESGDADRAVAVGEEAETLLEKLDLGGLAESIRLSVDLAAAYGDRGDTDRALQTCRTTLERAERFGSPDARSAAYRDASVREASNGDDATALDLARCALRYADLGDDLHQLAALRTVVAELQLELDPPDAPAALGTLGRVQSAWADGRAADRVGQFQLRARAHLALDELDAARSALGEALELTAANEAVSRATTLVLRGQVSRAGRKTAAARKEFLEAVQVLSGADADRAAAQLWFELGGLLRSVGEADAALDAFERAAASTGLRAGKGRTR